MFALIVLVGLISCAPRKTASDVYLLSTLKFSLFRSDFEKVRNRNVLIECISKMIFSRESKEKRWNSENACPRNESREVGKPAADDAG